VEIIYFLQLTVPIHHMHYPFLKWAKKYFKKLQNQVELLLSNALEKNR